MLLKIYFLFVSNWNRENPVNRIDDELVRRLSILNIMNWLILGGDNIIQFYVNRWTFPDCRSELFIWVEKSERNVNIELVISWFKGEIFLNYSTEWWDLLDQICFCILFSKFNAMFMLWKRNFIQQCNVEFICMFW